MIQLQNVSVVKNDATILFDLSLDIAERRVGIIGPNGSGKSTFVRLFNGLQAPHQGVVKVHGKTNAEDDFRKRVGFVFQNPDNQIVYPIVEEDLAFGLKKSGLSKQEILDRIDCYLSRFDLRHLKTRFTHQLSGGEKQLVALIGVLVMEPEFIVLDEPTTLLDLKNRTILIRVLESLEQNLVVVSHDLDLVAQLDRAILIENGRVIGDGKPAKVLEIYRDMFAC